ncbi:hypothetical protein [Pseudonocardia sp. GCM10023141]|uniref:hypothetical protein n=1 Tax=Pseudonocardia sp. GCM10023141 TaxID=3252653 RepID=UPI00360D5584
MAAQVGYQTGHGRGGWIERPVSDDITNVTEMLAVRTDDRPPEQLHDPQGLGRSCGATIR